MKTTIKSFAITFLFTFVLLTFSFGQTAPGNDGGNGSGTPPADGGSTGGTVTYTTCPDVSFKRNNGNGTCWGYVQLRVVFPDQFSNGFVTPKIVDITYQGVTIKFDLPDDGIVGVPTYTGQGYVGYCIGGEQFPGLSKEDFNIPPANKLVVTFKYGTGETARFCTVVEN